MSDATTLGQAAGRQEATYGALFRNRNFNALWIGQLISTLGDRLHQIALLVLVGLLTGNDLRLIGLVWVAVGLPSLFGLVAGALVDRWDRKRVMIGADLFRAPLVIALPLFARVDLLWVYLFTFLITTAGLFFKPARQAVLPDIVPKQQLHKANSFTQFTDTTADVLGYPIAGLLVAGFAGALARESAINIIFYIDAFTYLLSALLIYAINVPRRYAEQVGGAVRNTLRMVAGGLRFVWSHRILLTNTVLFTLGPLIGAALNTLSFGYVTEIAGSAWFYGSPLEDFLGLLGVQVGPEQLNGLGYAILEGALGLGSVVGALAVGKWGGRYRKGPMILIGLIVMGVGLVALAGTGNLWIAALVIALTGVGNMMALIPSITLVHELTPGEFQGRVFSLRSVLVSGAIVASNALAGYVAERFGVQLTVAVAGSLLALLAGLAFLLPSAREAN